MGGKLGATPAFGKAAKHPIVVASKALRALTAATKNPGFRPGFSQRNCA
jgi:acyl dehydratase